MIERLTEEELVTWGSQPTSCVEARAAAQISELLDNQGLRCWNCPCGDLVFRDSHYDLECGKCGRVQVDADEFQADVEIHKLRADNGCLRAELATAQEILLQERELLTAENDKLLKVLKGVTSSPVAIEAENAKLCNLKIKYGRHIKSLESEKAKLRTEVRTLEGLFAKKSREWGIAMRADNAKLREALESIREQTKCRSVKGVAAGKASGCWFADYGRHAPDCNWEISKEAAEALAGEADK